MITGETLGLIKAGIDEVRKIQVKRKKAFWSRIAPALECKEGFYRSKIITGFKELLIHTKGASVRGDTKEALFETDFYPFLFARAYDFDLEANEDDLYNEIADIPADAMIALNRTWNKQTVGLLSNGFDTAYPIYDGDPLFSTSHSSATGVASRSNRANPTLALSSTNLEVGLMELWDTLDPNGEALEYESAAVLHVNNKLTPVARRIVEADKFAQTNDNDPNPTNSTIRVDRQPHLPRTSNNWYLKMMDEDEHGLRVITWFRSKVVKLPMDRQLQEGIVVLSRFRPTVLQWEGTWGSGS
jgi:hypothetical protein